MRKAAALVIGNEILTGKIQEANVAFLGSELFKIGISLERAVVIPDVPDTIIAEVNALREAHDLVFTSGGVGPTHDDLTMPSVAAAFGRKVVRSAEVEGLLRLWHQKKGREVTEDDLRLADIIEGCQLVRTADVPWPTVIIDNVYVLPGVPEVFRLKLQVLLPTLDAGEAFVSRAVYTTCREGEIAALLQRLTQKHPTVVIGSYLAWNDPEYKTKLTFDAPSADHAQAAADELAEELGDQVVRRS